MGVVPRLRIQKYNQDHSVFVLVKKGGEIIDILPFKFDSYKDVDFDNIESLSSGLENFIDKKPVEKKIDSKTQELIGKLNRQLTQQQETIKSLEGGNNRQCYW